MQTTRIAGRAGILIAIVLLVAASGIWLSVRRGNSESSPLKDWSYPGASVVASLEEPRLTADRYVATNDFEKVVQFYHKKLGLGGTGGDPTFVGTGGSIIPGIGPGESASSAIGTGMRTNLMTKTFLHRAGNYTLLVHVSRAEGDGMTSIILARAVFAPDQASAPPGALSLRPWEYPQAQKNSGGLVLHITAWRYTASDAPGPIWKFYREKLGLLDEAAADSSKQGSGSVTLLLPMPERAGVVEQGFIHLSGPFVNGAILSRTENEDQTHLVLVGARK